MSQKNYKERTRFWVKTQGSKVKFILKLLDRLYVFNRIEKSMTTKFTNLNIPLFFCQQRLDFAI